jgi:hypothetical protein
MPPLWDGANNALLPIIGLFRHIAANNPHNIHKKISRADFFLNTIPC